MAEAVTGSTLVSLRRPSSGRDYLRMETQQYASFSAPFARINVIKALTEAVGTLPDLEAPGRPAYFSSHHLVARLMDAMLNGYVQTRCTNSPQYVASTKYR